MAGACPSETSTGGNELFSEAEEELEAFENMMAGSFRMPNSGSATATPGAQQDGEDYDYDMDDELEHLAESEEVLRQEIDSIHVVADAAVTVTSTRLSSASLLDEEIFRDSTLGIESPNLFSQVEKHAKRLVKEDNPQNIGGNSVLADADDSLINEEDMVDHDDQRNDNNNTMDFSSILPEAKIDASKKNTGNLHDGPKAAAQHHQQGQEEPWSNDIAELKSLLEEFKRQMDASPPQPQDEGIAGARQSETTVSSSSVDAFFDEETAHNCVSRENAQAEDGIYKLLEDTFSLMFVCNIKSIGFAYSVFFFALQVAILVLIGFNILLGAPDGNPLNVPVGTRLDVIAAQVLALFVSLITQSDFLATFDLINVYNIETFLPLFEEATRAWWIVSNTCRFIVSALSIAISFILIVQSTTVIELFFNFAAVQFVSELDNIAFQLADNGYMVIGDLEEITRKLIDHVQFQQRKMVGFPCTKRRVPVKWVRISIFSVHVVILYSAWSIVRYRQATGQYLHSICQSFEVKFDDKVSNNELPYGPFSGIFEVYRKSGSTFEFKDGRPVYYKRNTEKGVEGHAGRFSYCKSEKAWVFTIDGQMKAKDDKCNWLLRSPETEAYSLGDVHTTGWSIWTDDALAPADPHFELSCGECKSDVDCSYVNGNCTEKTCVCNDDWTGRNCQISVEDPCSTLRAELSFTNVGVTTTSDNYSKAFFHLEGITHKERPVFYSYTVTEPIEILFYSEGRFNVIELRDGFDIDPNLGVQDNDLAKLRIYFQTVHSVMVDSNKVNFYINGVPDRKNKLTFVSELTTAMVPLSGNVTWREDWPTSGTTLHLSCLSSYLQSVCQSFEARFVKTLWNKCTENSCPFHKETDSASAAVLSYNIYEVSRDSSGKFEYEGRRPVYKQPNITFEEGSHPGKFSYCESEEAWVFTIAIDNVTKAESDECDWLLRSPKTQAYSLGDAPRTGWSTSGLNHTLVPADHLFQFTCGECQLRHKCTVSSGNRGIPVDVDGDDFKNAIRSYLDMGLIRYGSKISCWDVSEVTNMTGAFESLLTFNEPLCWDVSSVTDMNNMFNKAIAFNQHVSSWDVLSVTNMHGMFNQTTAFNQDISSWNVSSVTNMRNMFWRAASFNQDLSSWDVSIVTNMEYMFSETTVFNQDVSSWDVASVTNMGYMFFKASAFNQNLCDWTARTSSLKEVPLMFLVTTCPYLYNHAEPQLATSAPGGTSANPNPGPFCHVCLNTDCQRFNDCTMSSGNRGPPVMRDGDGFKNAIQSYLMGNTFYGTKISCWDVSEVTNMTGAFKSLTTFNEPLCWDVSSVTDMENMFFEAIAFNQDVSSWDVLSVTNMHGMFYQANSFNQDISSWNVSSVTDMRNMFWRAASFNQALPLWDVSSVTDMEGMFEEAVVFNQNLSPWDVSSVTNMRRMMDGAKAFNHNLSSWDVSSVMDMENMFYKAIAFNQNVSSWDVLRVTNMYAMFNKATAFNQDISSWNVSSVSNMGDMFWLATSFNQDLSSWDVSIVTNMEFMFSENTVFNQNLSSWDVSSVRNMRGMMDGAKAFNHDLSSWNVSSVTSMKYMFFKASAFNQDLSLWNVVSVTNMYRMFYKAIVFNQDLCDWAVKTPSLVIQDNDAYNYYDYNYYHNLPDEMFIDTSCPDDALPELAAPGTGGTGTGTTANPHPGPFCYKCTNSTT